VRPAPHSRRSKKRSQLGIALALLVAGVVLIFGPTLALNLWDSYLAHMRDTDTARWMAKHLAHAPAGTRSGGRSQPAVTSVIAPGRDGYLLEIPRLNLRLVVHMLEPIALTGVPTPTLTRYGLGEIPYTTTLRNVSPGGNGTTAIAGHRTTHGAPFRRLDLLQPGDRILVRKSARVQEWRVSGTAVIAPTDVDAIRSHPGKRRLVLLSCTPPFSAQSRLMVVAEPAGAVSIDVRTPTPAMAQSVSNTPAFAQTRPAFGAVATPGSAIHASGGGSMPVRNGHPPTGAPANVSAGHNATNATPVSSTRPAIARKAGATAVPHRSAGLPVRAHNVVRTVTGTTPVSHLRPGPNPVTVPSPYTPGSDVLWSTSDRQHEHGETGSSDRQREGHSR
jgi:sortase A